MVEKPQPEKAPSNISIVGRYILHPEIFTLLEKTPKGSGGEIQLTDAMKMNISTRATYGYRFDGKRYDCGNHLGLFKANVDFATSDPIFGEQAKQFIKQIAEGL